MDTRTKEVIFYTYCTKCEHKDVKEIDMPCNECLAQGFNENSRKPICYKEKKA